MNYRAIIAYDGTEYFGWQIQANHRTVQAELSSALAKLEGASVIVHGAGRTDTGVHAEGQVASFRLTREWQAMDLQRAINGNLPQDIRVMAVESVDDEFHARYSARGKTYRYQLCNAEVMSPLIARYTWHYPYALNIEKLTLDSEVLVGTHDFSAFTVASCVSESKVRTITNVRVEADQAMITFYFAGEGFLRYQVRTMVSCLLGVNRGRLGSIPEIIKSRNRQLLGSPAPAKGLTLMSVEY